MDIQNSISDAAPGEGPLAPTDPVNVALAVGGVAAPPQRDRATNMADKDKFKTEYEFVKNEIIPLMQHTRDQRRALEEKWKEILRMDRMEHDDNQKYVGRSQSYIPVGNNNLNTIVTNLSRGLFPSDEYIGCQLLKGHTEEKAALARSYMRHELENIAKLRQNMKPFLRSYASFGNAIMKWMWKDATAYRPAGFHVSTRNLFNWYIYPVTANSIDEAVMCFDDADLPRHIVEEMGRKKVWLNVEDGLQAGLKGQENDPNEAENVSANGIDGAVTGGAQLGDLVRVTEVWTYMKVHESALDPEEDKNAFYCVQIVIAGNSEPLLIQRHPYKYGRIPYVDARTEIVPGFYYGRGFGQRVQPFQYLVNDFANQTNDNGIYSLIPIPIINPGLFIGPPKPMAPGVAQYVADIDQAIKFERPPAEQVGMGMQMISMWMNHAQSLGGAPPILQGAKGDKTATTSQILQRNATTPIQDHVEDIELSAMVPMMKACWALSQEKNQGPVIARVAGAPVEIDPALLKEEAEFQWLASSQNINSQQRAQQAIGFMQAVMPLVPVLAQKGYDFDPVPLMRRLYTDALGFRGFDQIVKPIQMGAPGMMPPQGMPGALPPGMSPTGGDRVRSAMEQVTGQANAGEMAVGEGEDFMEVRQNADDIAGNFEG